MPTDPTDGVEREHKFEVAPEFELPSFADVRGVRVLGDDVVELVATYYDTPDLRLTRAGASLRYRSDDGWTVKLPAGDGSKAVVRRENHFDGTEGSPPAAAANLVTGWTDVDLTAQGREEARAGGRTLVDEGLAFDIAFTSVLIAVLV